nr:class E vacuolar protein-sorting machinery protein hse1-like [Aegilops tauschii subsp. strangulata]
MATHSATPQGRKRHPQAPSSPARPKPDRIFIRNVAHIHTSEQPVVEAAQPGPPTPALSRERATTTTNNPGEEPQSPTTPCRGQDHHDGLHPHQGTATRRNQLQAQIETENGSGSDPHRTSIHRSGANASGGITARPPHGDGRPAAARQEPYLAGLPQRRHLHGRGLAPPPPTSASAPPSIASLQPPSPCSTSPPLHRAPRRASTSATKIRAVGHPISKADPKTTCSARRGSSGAPLAPAAFDGRAWPPPPALAAAAAGGGDPAAF